MSYPERSASFKLGPWPRGINNVKDLADLGKDELADSENFFFDDDGKAESRPGLVKRVSTTKASGFFPATNSIGVYFDNGGIYKVDVRTWETTLLASGYSVSEDVSWTKIGPRLFFTNGKEHGRIHVPTWEVLEGFGTANPGLEVTLSALGYGNLRYGRYFVGISFVDSFGEESGIPALHFIETTADGGINIALSGAVPANIETIRVYATGAGGNRKEMFRIAELDSAETSFQFTSNEFGAPAETLFLDDIPVPDLVTSYNGYLFFAVNERVWSSQAQRYGLYHIDDDEVGCFPEDVSVLERGVDGIWIVADVTYAYVGKGPKEFELVDNVFNFPALKFSGKQVAGRLFGDGFPKDVPFWFSTRGGVVGLENGEVRRVMEGKAEPDHFRKGVSGTIEHNGVRAVMTAVDEYTGPKDSLGLQDTFGVRVIRRGITDT